jgi:hypothetical protein
LLWSGPTGPCRPQETLYGCLDSIALQALFLEDYTAVSLTVEGLQVDNQLEHAGFPVVLRPRAVPHKRRDDGRKFALPGQSDHTHAHSLTSRWMLMTRRVPPTEGGLVVVVI